MWEHRAIAVPENTRRWVEARTGGRIERLRCIRRKSTEVHAVHVRTPSGATLALAIRRFVDAYGLATDPWYQPANEAYVLQTLEPTPVPAPRLLAADIDAQECDVPTLLTELVPGRNGFRAVPRGDLGPWLLQMAEAVVSIHGVADPGGLMGYESYKDMRGADPPRGSSRPDLWRRVFKALDRRPPATPKRFIHRDYHQENTMWMQGRLTGVIDWTSACIGPIDIDLARMRLNLAGEISVESAEGFLRAYREAIGSATYEPEPYWELLDFADVSSDDEAPANATEAAELDRFESLVASVLSKLG